MSEKQLEFLKSFLVTLVPIGASSIISFITKPFEDRLKIESIRKRLLEELRFKMAVEMANTLPDKKRQMSHDDYVDICKTKLTDYFTANSDAIADFLRGEKIFQLYVRIFNIFKYSIVLIPILAVLCFVILYIFFPNILTLKNCVIGTAILVIFTIGLWLFKERAKDKYLDLCSKYEAVE